MTTTTLKQVNTATKELETAIKRAHRRLFEFQTMMSVYEFMQGKFETYKNASSAMQASKKSVK